MKTVATPNELRQPTNQVRALRMTVGPEHAQYAFLFVSHNNILKRSSQSRPSALSSIIIVPAGSGGREDGSAEKQPGMRMTVIG